MWTRYGLNETDLVEVFKLQNSQVRLLSSNSLYCYQMASQTVKYRLCSFTKLCSVDLSWKLSFVSDVGNLDAGGDVDRGDGRRWRTSPYRCSTTSSTRLLRKFTHQEYIVDVDDLIRRRHKVFKLMNRALTREHCRDVQ